MISHPLKDDVMSDRYYNSTELSEKRQHRRLGLRMSLGFDRMDACRYQTAHTMTENVSTGGLYFETAVDDIEVGEHLALTLDVPAGDGRFPQHGQISTISRVVRKSLVDGKKSDSGVNFTRYGIAVRFQQPLKLSF